MSDKSWVNWSDLKFIARKREFWLSAIACGVIGAVIGWLV
jgi:hypothetical protein